MKFLTAVSHPENIELVDDESIKLMPRVLRLLCGQGYMHPTKYNGLEEVFCYIREWSMPLLFNSSRTCREMRRSERIRKKAVKQHIELLRGGD